jgi:integrase
MTRNSSGEKFTLYGLRHFCAVMAIIGGIDIYTIARNMGTSVQVIESYYGKHAILLRVHESGVRKNGNRTNLIQRWR